MISPRCIAPPLLALSLLPAAWADCPEGVWKVEDANIQTYLAPAPAYRLVSHGEVTMTFRADGSATFLAQDLRFVGPTLRKGDIESTPTLIRSHEFNWTWRRNGVDRIIMTNHGVRRSVEQSATHTVMPPPAGARDTLSPPRVSDLSSVDDVYSGWERLALCREQQLQLTLTRETARPFYPRGVGSFVRP